MISEMRYTFLVLLTINYGCESMRGCFDLLFDVIYGYCEQIAKIEFVRPKNLIICNGIKFN